MTREELLARLERRGVDARVRAAVAEVDRALFVPPELRGRAWDDEALPIGAGQTISQPYLVAHMVELLAPAPGDRVLDVGTGSGYHAALLARLAGRVWSVERHAELSVRAGAALAAAGIDTVELVVGDGARGHPPAAPFAAVNVAAAVSGPLPPALLEQLADGGRLVAPVRDGRGERLVRVVRHGDRWRSTGHGPVRFVPLVRAPADD